ncbi:hypothetical protein JZ751_012910 [Albula glossodonta]|uniref:Uncharacterized protein n=1 Tax=Albula glossodonta TaxID=121402 RepID=A0A8T2N090_9TELE|nr:hypothetical protein JZ751_012910 [Albula glossodonta]
MGASTCTGTGPCTERVKEKEGGQGGRGKGREKREKRREPQQTGVLPFTLTFASRTRTFPTTPITISALRTATNTARSTTNRDSTSTSETERAQCETLPSVRISWKFDDRKTIHERKLNI